MSGEGADDAGHDAAERPPAGLKVQLLAAKMAEMADIGGHDALLSEEGLRVRRIALKIALETSDENMVGQVGPPARHSLYLQCLPDRFPERKGACRKLRCSKVRTTPAMLEPALLSSRGRVHPMFRTPRIVPFAATFVMCSAATSAREEPLWCHKSNDM